MSVWGNSWGASWGNAWGRMRELEHRRACPERAYLIPADRRRYIMRDDRALEIPAEDRRYTVKGC
jgi:hypothetical protein